MAQIIQFTEFIYIKFTVFIHVFHLYFDHEVEFTGDIQAFCYFCKTEYFLDKFPAAFFIVLFQRDIT